MFATAHVFRGLTPWLNAPMSVLAYAVCLWRIGGIDATQIAAIRELANRRFARRGRGR
jgi:hypothetical protein